MCVLVGTVVEKGRAHRWGPLKVGRAMESEMEASSNWAVELSRHIPLWERRFDAAQGPGYRQPELLIMHE